MKPLPEDFKEMLKDLLGNEAPKLITALDQPPITSVRLNRRKPGAEFAGSSPVKWCSSGLYLDHRPEFIMDPLLHAGAYYVQDASSMIYESVVSSLLSKFDTPDNSGIHILDLCAAPGGKTTAMINALPEGGFITANEFTKKRVVALQENIDRWGYPNVKVTNKDSAYFANQGEVYDIVAVDAPCSGEGMMRKEEIARTQWSWQLVKDCAELQKEILSNASQALKPGGFLVYSTCTFNHLENEENAEYIHRNLGLLPVDPDFPEDWGIPGGIRTNLPVFRFMPHVTKGEGLFLSIFKKQGEWHPSKQPLLHNSKLSTSLPKINVDKETAIKYLQGESVVLPADSPRGLVLISYKGYPLGEAKNIGSRANNHYPKNRRILKR